MHVCRQASKKAKKIFNIPSNELSYDMMLRDVMRWNYLPQTKGGFFVFVSRWHALWLKIMHTWCCIHTCECHKVWRITSHHITVSNFVQIIWCLWCANSKLDGRAHQCNNITTTHPVLLPENIMITHTHALQQNRY